MEEKVSVTKNNTKNMPYTGQGNKHIYTESMDSIWQRKNRTHTLTTTIKLKIEQL